MLPLAWYGDDFTGASDTLATLAVSVRTLTDTGTLTDVVTAILAPSVAPLGRTLLVYYERRYRPGWTGIIDHDPQAKLDYTWDWTDWLGDDTITSSTVTAKVEEARDPTDVVTIDDVWPSPKTITAWISGGVHGTPCAVTCRITTTAGRIDDVEWAVSELDTIAASVEDGSARVLSKVTFTSTTPIADEPIEELIVTDSHVIVTEEVIDEVDVSDLKTRPIELPKGSDDQLF